MSNTGYGVVYFLDCQSTGKSKPWRSAVMHLARPSLIRSTPQVGKDEFAWVTDFNTTSSHLRTTLFQLRISLPLRLLHPPSSCIYRGFRATFKIKSLVQYPQTAKLTVFHLGRPAAKLILLETFRFQIDHVAETVCMFVTLSERDAWLC